MPRFSSESTGILASLTALSLCAAILMVAHSLNIHFAPLLPASLGAAAVLMFLAPNSSMASYRAFLLGNSCSAVIGASFYFILGNTHFVAIAAVGCAILCMHWLKCQHPPGGATALLFVVLGDQLLSTNPLVVLILFESCLGVFAASSYVHRRLSSHSCNTIKPKTKPSNDALNTAIKSLKLETAIGVKKARHLNSIINCIEKYTLKQEHTCRDLPLQRDFIYFDTSIEEALKRFKANKISRLPILSKDQTLMGEFSLSNLMNTKNIQDNSIEKLIKKYRYTGQLESLAPQHCGQLISELPVVKSETNAIQIISSTPSPFGVVDNTGKFLGMYNGD